MTPDERVRSVRVPCGNYSFIKPQVFFDGHWRDATEESIRRTIAKAVAAERERCAAICTVFANDMRRQAKEIDADAGEGAGDNCLEHAEAGDSIVARIRA